MANEINREEEQARLERVKMRIRASIAELEPEVSGLRSQVTDIRKRFWEDVTLNTSTHEDFEETFYSIKQQEALLSERERSHLKRLQRLNGMKRLLPSPYFGRIDFTEQGMKESEAVYIGVASLADEEELSFLVYDWRTPIASMYYDFMPGPAHYDTPGGRIDGEMTLKRQYQIRDGELRHVFDTSMTIGDELLQQALGQGADAQMKSIVATIQREQNAIIRDETSRMLIVQGAAGSGKTSAALQRAAYLLYRNRDKLRADQLVLFSPNGMFNSYVATVLPELGEENMQQTTFQEYLSYWLEGSLALEDPFEQMEYVLTAPQTPDYEARMAGIAYKASERFLHALQQYALWLGKEGMRFVPIRFQDRELISAARMREQFYSYDPNVRLANRVILLRDWLLKELSRWERREREANWVQDEVNYLDPESYDEAYRTVLRKYRREEAVFDFTDQYDGDRRNQGPGEESLFDFADQEEELLREMIVKAHAEPLKREVKRLHFIDFVELYEQLFEDGDAFSRMTGETEVPASWPEICRQTQEKLNGKQLFYEDATPYLYVKELIEGTRINTEVRHVFVDEGQDYSPFQYAFLKKLFPRARMTVLGDFNQAIFAQATNLQEEASPLVRLYGEEETRLIRLVRSYRSTQEIVCFTKSLLPWGGDIVPFERSGEKPRFLQVSSSAARAARMAEDLAALTGEGLGSVAVITKTAAEASEAYGLLLEQGCESLRLITKETLSFEKGIAVIPSYLAKGVEFDAVLVYDASSAVYGWESERKLFYTVCTRAMHKLLLYAVGEWTPFIEGIDRG
ncbi:RNA polymerase recycling motor HelD [Paenibacillus ferrarius]|uniref:RNA polymerase recycling motor HelD n=1 Tax=Paenibacillus ferrarius TaxID=1469647 RepID=UPI003D2D1543